MRAFLWFLAVIAGTLALAALLAYPAYELIHPLKPEWRFDKVGSRLWEFGLLPIAIVWLARRLRLTSLRDWGYGAPRPRWLRQFTVGCVAGALMTLPMTVSMLALGLRVPPADLALLTVGKAVLVGIGSGLSVSFLEETVFRGLLQGAVVRDLGRPLVAIALVSALFAALHFLGSTRIPHEQVTSHSGIVLLAAAAGNFATPALILDRLLALFAVGLLLGLATWWTGSIAFAVGLHAGWIFVIKATVGTTAPNPNAPLAWLISDDGYTGWLVFAWTLVIVLAAVALRGRFRPWRRTD